MNSQLTVDQLMDLKGGRCKVIQSCGDKKKVAFYLSESSVLWMLWKYGNISMSVVHSAFKDLDEKCPYVAIESSTYPKSESGFREPENEITMYNLLDTNEEEMKNKTLYLVHVSDRF